MIKTKFISALFALCILFIIALAPNAAYAGEELNQTEYNRILSGYDLSAFDELDDTTTDFLNQLGLLDFNYKDVLDFSFSDVFVIIKNIVFNSVKTPLYGSAAVIAIILLSALFQGFRQTVENGEMSEAVSAVSAVAVSLILIMKIKFAASSAIAAIEVCANFIYAFFPAFCIIVAASGSTVAAFSTNSLLLSMAQALNFISQNIFMPLSNCFLALGICSSIRNELNLRALIKNLKGYLITAISVCSGIFVTVLTLKTSVASRADAIGMRSVRFAINSVVPVIGGAVSEGLLSIQAYSSLIRSSVGVAGIAAVVMLFLPPVLEIVFWRFFLTLSSSVSDIFGDKSVSDVLSSFSDALLVMNVVLVLCTVTTVISIGILIAAKGSV